jgi:hypothetical protein
MAAPVAGGICLQASGTAMMMPPRMTVLPMVVVERIA